MYLYQITINKHTNNMGIYKTLIVESKHVGWGKSERTLTWQPADFVSACMQVFLNLLLHNGWRMLCAAHKSVRHDVLLWNYLSYKDTVITGAW